MTTNIAPLARDWLQAKKDEAAANKRRLDIEAQMIAALDVPTEGSKTHKIDGYKITATQPVSRKLDLDVWAKVKDKIASDLHPVKTKIEADATGCKYLAGKEPKLWAKIAAAFTATPGKVGFKVEEEI